MKILMDFETRSICDLRKSGAARYAQDPSTSIICLAYRIGDAPVQLWVPTYQHYIALMPQVFAPQDLLEAIRAGYPVHAHNAFFERMIWENICVARYGWPDINPEQWYCTAAKAAAQGLPRKLGEAGRALRLKVTKDETGSRVMQRLSKPRKPTKTNPSIWHENPDDYSVTYRYCMNDVESELALDTAVRDLSTQERRVWLLDQRINHRGVRVDIPAVHAALLLIEEYTEQENIRLAELTGGQVTAATQREQLLNFVRAQGYHMADMRADTVTGHLSDPKIPPLVQQVLQIRQSLGKSSTAKYKALLNAVCADERVRDMFMYAGAHTLRWTGRLVQLQNLPRGNIKNFDMDKAVADIRRCDLAYIKDEYGEDKVMELLAASLRGMFIPSRGKRLLVADYNAIEARVLFWLADATAGLHLFATDQDPYKDMAVAIYGVTLEEVTKDQRQMGKQAILGLGYGMGWVKFMETCAKYGIIIDEEFAKRVVDIYRKTKFPEVPKFWYAMEDAAVEAVRTGKPVVCGKVTWFKSGRVLYCKAPCGQTMAYNDPQLHWSETPWGEEKQVLSYMTLNSVTKKWERNTTYAGAIVENLTQRVARNLMAEAMLRLEDAAYLPLMHSHDECVSERDIGQGSLEEYCRVMAQVPDWAKGCPIAVAGFEAERYRKD